MNSGIITGGVVKAAENAYTPQRLRRVLFAVTCKDSHGVQAFWNCEAEGEVGHHLGQTDDEWLDWLVTSAQPGAGIRLEYELASRPFTKNNVHVGEVRFLRVLKAEFPVRPAKAQPVEASP